MDGFEEHLSAASETLRDVNEVAEVALSLGRALATMGHGERAFEVVENAAANVARDSDVGLLLDAEAVIASSTTDPSHSTHLQPGHCLEKAW